MAIPQKHRKVIDREDFYRRCCKCGASDVQIHHVFMFAGKQINELFNYVPACVKCHKEATPHNNAYVEESRYFFEWVALRRMGWDMIHKYSKPFDESWVKRMEYSTIQAAQYNWRIYGESISNKRKA